MDPNDTIGRSPVILALDADRLARRVLIFCLSTEAALFLLDYHINYGRLIEVGAIRRLFNTAREDGLASWFAVTQTLFIGLTLWLLYALVKDRNRPRWRSPGYGTLGAFFIYMAIDDGAQLHERLASAYDAVQRNPGGDLPTFPSYTWQILFLPLFGAMGIFLLAFLWRELASRSSRILLLVTMMLIAVAVLLDFFEGLDRNHPLNVHARLAESPRIQLWALQRFHHPAFETVGHFSRSVEETLEMVAHSVFWFLLLRHTARLTSEIRVHLDANG